MHVVATAGHVDHGKSTLVRALTGMEPDRWAEERRRGMTIDLGFAWTTLPGGETVAFVDVPGHERFVPTMLAGVGPVPAVVFVVAADEGWRRQSAEHLAAIAALGVSHGLLVVTRSDLADPSRAEQQARAELAGSALGDMDSVAVSALTGQGLDDLRAALAGLVAGLPEPDLADDVRLWIDRSFTITGAGTVVTGTLTGGSLGVGDELHLASSGRAVHVRGLQTLGQAVERVDAVARVAVNLRGVEHDDVRRGDALLSPDRWIRTGEVDVAVRPGDALDKLPDGAHLTLHIGSAAIPVRVRRLGDGVARLRLASSLPLRIGDTSLLREPSNHDVLLGVTVLDPSPPPLARRGDAQRRADVLADLDGRADAMTQVHRRGIVTTEQLRMLGVRGELPAPLAGDWVVDDEKARALREQLRTQVTQHLQRHPLDHGMSLGAVAEALDLPDLELVRALLPDDLVIAAGRVTTAEGTTGLPDDVRRAVDELRHLLVDDPFAAPEAHRLRELGLGHRELAAAARAGALLVLDDAIVLLPGAARLAAEALASLPPTFTVSEARQAWGTTRRVALPLLDLLDRSGVTLRLPDGARRRLRTDSPH
jgi:selenocysteine-specific elongation factor